MYVRHVDVYPEYSISNYYTSHYKTMTIDLCGITFPSEKFVHINEYLNYYLFEYIVSGEGETECGKEKYLLSEGSLVIASPHSTISFRSNPKNPYKRLFFCPTGSLVDTLCSYYKINTPLHVTKADCEKEFMQIYDSMKNNTYSEEIWNRLLFEIILKASPILSDTTFSKSTSTAERIHLYIHQNIKTIKNISDIADALHTSTSNILHTYKKKYGVTPYTTITKKTAIHCKKNA